MREEALEMSRKKNGPEAGLTIALMINLGISYALVSRHDDAIRVWKEGYAVSMRVNGLDHPYLGSFASFLAGIAWNEGRLDEEEKMRQQVLVSTEKINGPEHRKTLLAKHSLGTFYARTGRGDEAREILQKLPNKSIRKWLVVGPIPLEGATGYQDIDKYKIAGESHWRPREGESFPGVGQERRWRACRTDDDILDFCQLFGKQIYSALAYAACYIWSEEDGQDVTLKFSADDQCAIFLNGSEIYHGAFGRSLTDPEEKVENLRLNRGLNSLLIKVSNLYGLWQSQMRITDQEGEPLEGLQILLDPNDGGFSIKRD